jgi:hypothetical protein
MTNPILFKKTMTAQNQLAVKCLLYPLVWVAPQHCPDISKIGFFSINKINIVRLHRYNKKPIANSILKKYLQDFLRLFHLLENSKI